MIIRPVRLTYYYITLQRHINVCKIINQLCTGLVLLIRVNKNFQDLRLVWRPSSTPRCYTHVTHDVICLPPDEIHSNSFCCSLIWTKLHWRFYHLNVLLEYLWCEFSSTIYRRLFEAEKFYGWRNELEYRLGSYSFRAVPYYPMETLCATGDEDPTLVIILYTGRYHWLEIRNQALKPNKIYTCVFPIHSIYFCNF